MEKLTRIIRQKQSKIVNIANEKVANYVKNIDNCLMDRKNVRENMNKYSEEVIAKAPIHKESLDI